MNIARSITFLVALTVSTAPSLAFAADTATESHDGHAGHSSSALIEAVRQATELFRDVRNVPEGYAPALGCVTGPVEGAMGVHFVNGSLLMDGELDITRPEALIYEFKDGVARLVGVEYIVLFDLWHQTHSLQDPPLVAGQLMNFNETPNRFGLPAFYELHVWAWRDNPLGAFVDWNPRVSCEGQ